MSANGRLFVLDLSGGRVMSVNTDGTDLKTLVSEGRHLPDGVVVDVGAGHIYWTNMGIPNRNDGSIMRADIDGGNVKPIVPEGATFTPKQLQIDNRVRMFPFVHDEPGECNQRNREKDDDLSG